MTVYGRHLVNLKCAYPKMTDADAFYAMYIASVVVPP